MSDGNQPATRSATLEGGMTTLPGKNLCKVLMSCKAMIVIAAGLLATASSDLAHAKIISADDRRKLPEKLQYLYKHIGQLHATL